MEETVLKKYTTTYGVRFLKSQKKRFLKELHSDFQQLGYDSTRIQGKKLLSKSDNYLFGSMKQLKTVIIVPYDTPEKKFWNKVMYYPFDGTKSASKTVAATYVPIVCFFVFIFTGIYVIQPSLKNAQAALFTSLILVCLTIFLVYWMMHGIQNKKNFNRNSASIATAVSIAGRLSKDERKRVGFLFIDKNKQRFAGAAACAKDFLQAGKNPTFIVLDCIGNGSQTQVAYTPHNRKTATEIAKYYPLKKKTPDTMKLQPDMQMPSIISYFKKAVVIASGELDDKNCLVVMGTGTGKDHILQLETLQTNEDMLYAFLHNHK